MMPPPSGLSPCLYNCSSVTTHMHAPRPVSGRMPLVHGRAWAALPVRLPCLAHVPGKSESLSGLLRAIHLNSAAEAIEKIAYRKPLGWELPLFIGPSCYVLPDSPRTRWPGGVYIHSTSELPGLLTRAANAGDISPHAASVAPRALAVSLLSSTSRRSSLSIASSILMTCAQASHSCHASRSSTEAIAGYLERGLTPSQPNSTPRSILCQKA